MPDLMSHLLIALILAEIFSIKKKSLVVLGALLPDLLSKGHLIYLHLGMAPSFSFVPFHTPAMIFLISLLIAPMFRYSKSKTIFLINLGALSHFLSDLTMKHFAIIGSRLFFPFSMSNYTLNLIWPEKSIYILIASLMIYILIRFIKKRGVPKALNKAKLKHKIR